MQQSDLMPITTIFHRRLATVDLSFTCGVSLHSRYYYYIF